MFFWRLTSKKLIDSVFHRITNSYQETLTWQTELDIKSRLYQIHQNLSIY